MLITMFFFAKRHNLLNQCYITIRPYDIGQVYAHLEMITKVCQCHNQIVVPKEYDI